MTPSPAELEELADAGDEHARATLEALGQADLDADLDAPAWWAAWREHRAELVEW